MLGAFIPERIGTSSPADNKRKFQGDAANQSVASNQGENGTANTSTEGVYSGFHFVWYSTSTLEALVEIANELGSDSPAQRQQASPPKPPPWISQALGSITPDTFQMDLLLHIAELGGGLQRDNLLITPNTSVQAYNICRRLGHIEIHPFMQACMVRLPEEAPLVSVMRLFQDPSLNGLNACPVHFAPPPAPFRQMFF